MQFQKAPQKFLCKGVDLVHPTNLLPPGKYPFLQNVRQYQEGVLEPRKGIDLVNSTPIAGNLFIHSICRTNEYLGGVNPFLRFLGASTKLYFGTTSFTQLDTGYNGTPMSMIPYRPNRSQGMWTYIADYLKMSKVDMGNGGTEAGVPVVRNVGILPPNVIPTAELQAPAKKIYPITSAASWTGQGNAGSPADGDRLNGTTISTIQYVPTFNNNGTAPGWACIVPAGGNLNAFSEQMHIHIDSEDTVVEEIHKISVAASSVTVTAISYEQIIASGPKFVVTIVLSQNLNGLARNSFIQIASEWTRVISVTNAKDGTTSLRCVLSSGHVATEAVTIPTLSIFCYLSSTHANGATITSPYVQTTVTLSSSGNGTLARNLGFGTLNLASVTCPITSQIFQLGVDDHLHIALNVDKPDLIQELKFIIDFDRGTTGTFAATDGTKNAFEASISPNSLSGTLTDSTTTQQALLNANTQALLDAALIPSVSPLSPGPIGAGAINPIGTGQSSTPTNALSDQPVASPIPTTQAGSTQLQLGQSQWSDILLNIGELIRVGGDLGVDLSQVGAIQLVVIATGTVVVKLNGLWTGGGFGPDNSQGEAPFLYRFRYRASTIGAISLPGPALRTGIQAYRQGVLLSCYGSADAQVDTIDVERLGGSAIDGWHYVGSVANALPTTFTDNQYTAAIQTNPALDIDVQAPFATTDAAQVFTVNTIGTTVNITIGGTTKTWAPGSLVVIGNLVTALYSMPNNGDSVFYVAESLGALTGVQAVLPDPTIMGTPLPVMWGPFQERFFACGDKRNAGLVYFTNSGNPDGMSDANYVEVCTNTEQMQNGCVYDSRAFAWSDKRFFFIQPTNDPANSYLFIEVPNGVGLYNRWCFCVGPMIWFLGADGIYETSGGTPVRISGDIAPLFPEGERKGYAINGYNPVDLTTGSGRETRLSYHDGYLYFDYLDSITGFPATWVYDVSNKSWYFDQFRTNTNNARPQGPRYVEVGTSSQEVDNLLMASQDGYLYILDGPQADNYGSPVDTLIRCTIQTPDLDLGDTRMNKLYGDIVLDLDAQSQTITVTPAVNNGATTLSAATYNHSIREITIPIDLGSTAGIGYFARNLRLTITWSSNSATPKMYYWEPTYLERPDDTFRRADDWENVGFEGAKYIRGFLWQGDTFGVSRTFNLEGDQGVLQSFTVNANGQSLLPFALTTPQIASLVRIRPTDSNSWREFKVSFIYDKYPDFSALITPYDDAGYPGAKFVQGLDLVAGGSTATITVQYDGDVNGPSFAADHSASGGSVFTKPYSFAVPFIAHELRLVPSAPIRIEKAMFVWEPAPELAANWITQATTHDIPGFQFLKDGYVAHISTADITYLITIDGNVFSYTITNSGGIYKKTYILFALGGSGLALKGKSFIYSLNSTAPFRLFKRDCEVRVRPWISTEMEKYSSLSGYRVVNPFGDMSRLSGAKI
jgi:hypothetical protein